MPDRKRALDFSDDRPALAHAKGHRLLIAGISVLLLPCAWWMWNRGHGQPDLAKGKPQAYPPAPPGFVLVKGGTFQMGSNRGDSDEEPVHAVTLSDFHMQEHEVTLGEFKTFVDASGYKTDAEKNGGSYIFNGKTWEKQKDINWRYDAQGKLRPKREYKHPVIHISWNDATGYAKWFTQNRKDGKYYRLPTEAEWEYAAGNGTNRNIYSWGNGSPSGKRGGNVADEAAQKVFKDWTSFENYRDGYVCTAPVASFDPNDLGLYDMGGNVWEWCGDWYDGYPVAAQTNPTGPEKGVKRVVRGGGWNYYARHSRVADRNSEVPDYCFGALGFRLVCPL